MTHADYWKTLFDFALMLLAILSVVYEKRLIALEKRLGKALRRRLRSHRHAARRPAEQQIRQLRAVQRPAPAAQPCPALPTPHRVA